MAVATSPLIARSGWIFIAFAVLVAWAVYHYAGEIAAVPFWLLAVLLVFLFRDPEREVTSQPLAVVSPVDGHIVAVEEAYDAFLNRNATKITIKMSFLGAYRVRSPIEGKVMERWFPSANKGKEGASTGRPDSLSAWIQTDEEDDVVLSMSQLSFINATHCQIQSGERIGHGQRCGFIHFGSQVDVFLPPNSRVLVREGSKVYSGSDVLALLIHK